MNQNTDNIEELRKKADEAAALALQFKREANRAESFQKQIVSEKTRLDSVLSQSIKNESETLQMAKALVALDPELFSIKPITEKVDFSVKDYDVKPPKVLWESSVMATKYSVAIKSTNSLVKISNHIVYGSYSGRSKGFEYLLDGSITNYKQIWFKNPESVVKKVKEILDTLAYKAKIENSTNNLLIAAELHLQNKYPNKTISKTYDKKFIIQTPYNSQVIFSPYWKDEDTKTIGFHTKVELSESDRNWIIPTLLITQ